MTTTKIRFVHILFLFAGLALLIYPCIYWNSFSGDAELHLIFGKNAAHGHLFEFNEGEKSSGASSVGYILMLSVLFQVLPATIVPIVVKIINYLAWVLILFTFYRLLQYKKCNKFITFAALLTVGFLPGSVYNSVIGMENVLFGLLTIVWFYYAIKFSYFSLNAPLTRKTIFMEVIFSFMLGMGTWVRPEAAPFFIIAISTRLFAVIYYKQPLFLALKKSIISIVSFLLPMLCLYFFIYAQTGMWIQSSITTRMLLGRIESHNFNLFIIDPKILIRLVAYYPITFFWIWGTICFFKNDWRDKIDELFAISLFSAFVILFTFVTGAAHLGRYMIFLIPFWVLITARGIEHAIQYFYTFQKIVVMIFSIFIVSLTLVYLMETKARLQLGTGNDFLNAINAPTLIKSNSDSLYQMLGCPKKLPVVIALAEAQIRYRLDDRFIIRSLDGRVDGATIKYIHTHSIDYISYLKERNVDFIVGDYSIPSFKNSLPIEKLLKLKIGEKLEVASLRITFMGEHNLSGSIYKVEKI